MSRYRRTRLATLAVAAAMAMSALVATSPATAKPVDNTVTLTILPAQLRLVPGESATIRLTTNYTTGYTWSYRVAGDRTAVTVVQKDPAQVPAGSPLGAPTTTDWVVTAKSKGTAVVKILTSAPGRDSSSVVGSLRVIVRR